MDGYEAIGVFGYEAIRLSVAHGPCNVNLVDFQQHLFFSLRPHNTVPILAFQSMALEFHSLSVVRHCFSYCALCSSLQGHGFVRMSCLLVRGAI